MRKIILPLRQETRNKAHHSEEATDQLILQELKSNFLKSITFLRKHSKGTESAKLLNLLSIWRITLSLFTSIKKWSKLKKELNQNKKWDAFKPARLNNIMNKHNKISCISFCIIYSDFLFLKIAIKKRDYNYLRLNLSQAPKRLNINLSQGLSKKIYTNLAQKISSESAFINQEGTLFRTRK